MLTLQIIREDFMVQAEDFFFFGLFRATPLAYGGSQARG